MQKKSVWFTYSYKLFERWMSIQLRETLATNATLQSLLCFVLMLPHFSVDLQTCFAIV